MKLLTAPAASPHPVGVPCGFDWVMTPKTTAGNSYGRVIELSSGL
jgi:hypothetical protein